MSIDLFNLRYLTALVHYMTKPTTFLLDTFFTVEEPVDSDVIDVDIERDGQRMASFVSPLVQGRVVKADGFTTLTHRPGYIKEKMAITPRDLSVREAGSSIYAPESSGESRMQRMINKKVKTLLDRITRREEWMAAQSLTTGKVTIAGEGIPSFEVDFSPKSTHLPVLASTAKWSETTSDPIENLRTWQDLIRDDGQAVGNKVVMGRNAWKSFFAHQKVKDALDNRRIVVGEVRPDLEKDGAQKMATWLDPNCEIWVYSGKYTLPDGSTPSYLVPENKVLFGATSARCSRHYARIQDLEAGMAVLRYFAKTFTEKDPSLMWIMMQSNTLPAPHQIDAFVCATVQDAA